MPNLTAQCSDCHTAHPSDELMDGYCRPCHAQYGTDPDMRDFEREARANERSLDAARDR